MQKTIKIARDASLRGAVGNRGCPWANQIRSRSEAGTQAERNGWSGLWVAWMSETSGDERRGRQHTGSNSNRPSPFPSPALQEPGRTGPSRRRSNPPDRCRASCSGIGAPTAELSGPRAGFAHTAEAERVRFGCSADVYTLLHVLAYPADYEIPSSYLVDTVTSTLGVVVSRKSTAKQQSMKTQPTEAGARR